MSPNTQIQYAISKSLLKRQHDDLIKEVNAADNLSTTEIVGILSALCSMPNAMVRREKKCFSRCVNETASIRAIVHFKSQHPTHWTPKTREFLSNTLIFDSPYGLNTKLILYPPSVDFAQLRRLLECHQLLSLREIGMVFYHGLQKLPDQDLATIQFHAMKETGGPKIKYFADMVSFSKNTSLKDIRPKVMKEEDGDVPQAQFEEVRQLRKTVTQKSSPASLIRSDQPKRIAICVSGQLRGFHSAFPSFRSLFRKYDVETFVSTWTDVGVRLPTGSLFSARFFEGAEFKSAWNNGLQVFGFDRLFGDWEPLFQDFTKSASEVEIGDIFETDNFFIEDDSRSEFSSFSNSKKMFYKMHSAHKMIPNPEEFDLIVRIRPDKPVKVLHDENWLHTIWNALDTTERTMFADHGMGIGRSGEFFVGDQFAIGRPAEMDVYTSVFADNDELRERNFPGTSWVGHAPIAHRLFWNNIKCHRADWLEWGDLVSPSISPAKVLKVIEQLVEEKSQDLVMGQEFLAAARKDAAASVDH